MRAIILAAVLTALSVPAFAGQAVTLKTDIFVSGPVTLGDLFDGAGRAASVQIAPGVNAAGSLVLDTALVQRVAMNAGLSWNNEKGLRRVIVRGGVAPATAGSSEARPVAGGVEVLTYNRSLQAGEIIQPEDISYAKVAVAPVGAPRDAEALIGKAAKRALRAGSAASLRDAANPIVVKKDDMVEVTFSNAGVSLSLQAKAMGPAAVGDSLSLMNPASKKIFQAVLSAPGQAVIGPEADRLRAQSVLSAQFASR